MEIIDTPKRGFREPSAWLTDRTGIWIAASLILAIGIPVFWDYLSFRKVYIFKDIGSDTYNQLYPFYVHLSEYLRSQGLPKWSFHQGMGQNIFPVGINNLFNPILYLFGRRYLVFVIAYVEVFKIVLAGSLFYLYLRTLSLTLFSSVIGALLMAFSGYMILGSGWYGHATLVVYGTFLLLAFEKLFKQNQWAFFPLAVALIGSYSAFYLYIFSLFLLLYTIFRFIDERGFRFTSLSALLLKMFGLGLLGVLISAVFMLSDLTRMLQSPRVSGDAAIISNLSSRPVFALEAPLHYITAAMRFFSNDMLGTGSLFRGWYNYLEAPALYAGTLSLLLFPHVFIYLDNRHRFLYAAFLGFWALLILFPYFRYAFYMFAGNYYKGGLSFFIPVTVLFYGLKALSTLERSSRLNPILLVATLMTLMAVLFFPYEENGAIIPEVRMLSITSLMLFSFLLLLLGSCQYRYLAKAALLIWLCIELGFFAFFTVNKRVSLTAEELGARVGFNDYSIEAVRYIKSMDESFYRISKGYRSGLSPHCNFNDAQIQDFYGTSSYYSFNQKYYLSFLFALNIIEQNDKHHLRCAPGLGNRPILQTFASIKYHLTRNDRSPYLTSGYDLINRFHNVYVLKNNHYLPLGFTYDRYVTLTHFSTITKYLKDIALMKAFVIDDDRSDSLGGLAAFDKGRLKAEYTMAEYRKDVSARKTETLKIDYHDQNTIRGTIALTGDKLLFFSIPYDKGWRCFVDGEKVPLERVNIGFMGVLLRKGTHTVELRYGIMYFGPSLAVSLSALLLYLCLVFRLPLRNLLSRPKQAQKDPSRISDGIGKGNIQGSLDK